MGLDLEIRTIVPKAIANAGRIEAGRIIPVGRKVGVLDVVRNFRRWFLLWMRGCVI